MTQLHPPRIARPEDVVNRPGVSEALEGLGPPWATVSTRDLCRILDVSPLCIPDWRHTGRGAPPQEDPALYPRVRGHRFRLDRVLVWIHELLGRSGQLEPWHIGRDYVHATFGAQKATSPDDLNEHILHLQRLGIIELDPKPLSWPDFAPY